MVSTTVSQRLDFGGFSPVMLICHSDLCVLQMESTEVRRFKGFSLLALWRGKTTSWQWGTSALGYMMPFYPPFVTITAIEDHGLHLSVLSSSVLFLSVPLSRVSGLLL